MNFSDNRLTRTTPPSPGKATPTSFPLFTVTRITPCRKGNLVAFCEIEIRFAPTKSVNDAASGSWIRMQGFRLTRSANGTLWVGEPSTCTAGRWYQMVTLPTAYREQLKYAVLSAWEDYESNEQSECPLPNIGQEG